MKSKNLLRFSLCFSRGWRRYSSRSRTSLAAWGLLTSRSNHDKTALPTIIREQCSEADWEEFANATIPMFDRLQGGIEIFVNGDRRICVA